VLITGWPLTRVIQHIRWVRPGLGIYEPGFGCHVRPIQWLENSESKILEARANLEDLHISLPSIPLAGYSDFCQCVRHCYGWHLVLLGICFIG